MILGHSPENDPNDCGSQIYSPTQSNEERQLCLGNIEASKRLF